MVDKLYKTLFRIIGVILITVGYLYAAYGTLHKYGSPLDQIIGEDIAPFTAFILLFVGYTVKGFGQKNKDEFNELKEDTNNIK